MSFLSGNFGLFLVLCLCLYYAVPLGWRRAVLLLFSLGFYASWSVWHTGGLLLLVALVHWTAGGLAPGVVQRRRRFCLGGGVAALLGLLIFFKCAQQVVQAWPGAAGSAGFDLAALLVIPLGLSYYIFKLLGYLLDVYWEKVPVQRDFLSLALYASFFPQIVSGPIQRAGDFFDQLAGLGQPSVGQVTTGLQRMLFGVFKKVVIADQLALIVDRLFANPAGYSSLELLIGAYCYAMQLYADFSGLTDLALGLGMLFGITGPENFNQPYLARNLQEFWRRWHMSLTSWLGDYLFLPLRMGLRHLGNTGLALALLGNMLAVALWHGLTWTYLIFGVLNGVFIVVSALTLRQRNAFFKRHARLQPARSIWSPVATFHLFVFALIFFRAADLGAALGYVTHLIPGLDHSIPATRLHWAIPGLTRTRFLLALGSLALLEGLTWFRLNRARLDPLLLWPRWPRWTLYYAMILLVFVSARQTQSFIYGHF
ncbi:MAG: MBOAT family O-acyltransferase [Verrucomicrobiota bacterium]